MSKAHFGSSVKYQKKQAVRHKRTEKRKLLKEAKEVLKTVISGIDI